LLLGYGVFFLLGMGFMACLRISPHSPRRPVAAKTVVSTGAVAGPILMSSSVRQPWGEFEYIKLPLEEPKELLPDTSQPLAPPRWFFEKYSAKGLAEFFQSCHLRPEQAALLLDSKRWEPSAGGIFVSPPPDVVLELKRGARERIYAVLAESEVNSAQRDPFRFQPEAFEEWAASTGLAEEQIDIVSKLTYMQGGSLCFCDGPIVQRVFSANDFRRFVKALYGERTFLMRLIINSQTDIDALIKYWAKGGRAQTLRPLFESMAKVPGGSSINISYLLPTFARLRLYTYANDSTDPAPTKENCFWTAMNFFNDKPDPQFFSAKNTRRVLDTDYYKTQSAPAYGDLLLLSDSAGQPIHLCVYLADDVVFTKNGGDYMQPWVLMKIADMLAYYNAKEPAQVTVYRSKKG